MAVDHHDDSQLLVALLAEARGGSVEDRERLFALCKRYLEVLARSHVESWLRAKVDASDIVQQTMLEAHRDFDRFTGQTGGEWLAWLRKILARNAADFVRRYRTAAKRNAAREVPLDGHREADSHLGGPPEPAALDPSPSQQVMRRDEELRLALAMNQLSPDYREVIMLRNLQRLPFDEVARRMNRSRPAAQMLWGRAIQRLQSILQAQENGTVAR